jgi:ketosteroid isomerase-like protein
MMCIRKSSLLLTVVLILLVNTFLRAQHADVKKILALMERQTTAWNKGDINGYMDGYWQNDSLMFIGKSGLTYGWQQTLENYKRGYPDTTSMGKLSFTVLHVKNVAADSYFVVGKWQLTRSMGNISGH